MKEIKTIIEAALKACKDDGALKLESVPDFQLEVPKQPEHGDLSTNAAMMLARSEGVPPRKIAEAIVSRIAAPSENVLSVSIAGPGFINFKINPAVYLKILHKIYKEGEKFGRSDEGKDKKVQVEFVSANPTGPLHVGHGRGAVYGDALASILKAVGYKVTKEYYLNDAGVQMQTLGKSVWLRMQELQGAQIEFPENCYQGAYIKDIAKEVLAAEKKFKNEDEAVAFCGKYAGEKIHNEIVNDLKDCGVAHDVYFNESDLHKKNKVEKAVSFLMKKGDAFESEGAVWFKSTKYGDEKDRVLKKSDGFYTYFAADIAYHKEKYDRGFDRVIDVWGADHAGHVPRMKAAITAIGRDPRNFDAVLIQLVNLMRGGELVSMSTRSAQYETLRTLLDEVGRDVCRYFFLMRSHDAQLDFDIELAKSQTMENPVYYIQYAHARIESVFAKAKENKIKLKFSPRADLSPLNLPEEIVLARILGEYPSVVAAAAKELSPHKISFYLLELAQKFQSYYTKGNKDPAYRFLTSETDKTLAKCYLLKNIQIVLKNGLDLLGLRAPERMESSDD